MFVEKNFTSMIVPFYTGVALVTFITLNVLDYQAYGKISIFNLFYIGASLVFPLGLIIGIFLVGLVLVLLSELLVYLVTLVKGRKNS